MLELMRDAAVDFHQAAEQPPEQPPEEQHWREDRFAFSQLFTIALEEDRREDGGGAQHYATQERAVENRNSAGRGADVGQEDEAAGDLQQGAKHSRQTAALSATYPNQSSPFKRPGCGAPATVQSQWDGQCQEQHTERHEGFDQQALCRLPGPVQHGCERQVQGTHCKRTECQHESTVMEHCRLQAESHHWRAKHQRSINVAAQLGRLPGRKQDGDGYVEEEEEDQERLGAGKELRVVAKDAKGGSNEEGKLEAEEVARAPRFEPGNGQDAAVQNGVVAEEQDVVACSGGGQNGGQESAADGENGEGLGVLQHRQRC